MPGLRRNPRPAPGTGSGPRLSPSEILERDELDPHAAIAGDAGLVQVGAVAAGDEGQHRGKGLSVSAWLAIVWVGLVVLIAVLAKTGLVTWGDPQNSIASCAHKGPFSDMGTAAGHFLGCDSNGRDMMARLALTLRPFPRC